MSIPALTLDASVTLSSAATLHRQLVDAVAIGGPVSLDGSFVDEMDFSGVQLILAAARAATQADVEIRWATQPSAGAARAFVSAGFDIATFASATPSGTN